MNHDEEVKTLLESMNHLWTQMKTELDKVKKDGEQSAEQKAKVEKMEKDLEKIEEKMADLEAKMNRPAPITEPAETKEAKAALESKLRKQAFFKALASKGDMSILSPDEAKTMVLADESSLGFLAPPEFMADVIKNVVQISPFRQFVTVRTVTSRELQRPKRDTTLAASWIGETGLPLETKKKHSMLKYPVHKLGALAIVSQEALQDLPFFEQDIREEFAEQFALAEGQSFLKGDAVEKPQGILTHPDVEVLTSSVSGKIDFDDIFDLMTSLKEPYWPSATFYFQRLTLRALRKIKDANGQYIWEPSPAVGTPPTIAGQPYVLMPDMDDVTANKKPIIYGDLRRGYMIVDRVDLAIQVLREKYVPETGYLATKRVGGQVQLAEAIKVLKVKP